MRFKQYFIFGNIHISLCAVVMCAYTFFVFRLEPDVTFLIFVLFATLTSYSFHWYLTPDLHSHSERYTWVNEHKHFLLTLFLISLVTSMVFIYILRDHILILAGTAIFTFFYSASKIPFPPFSFLKKIIIGKTIYLALAWTIVTTFLPVKINNNVWTLTNTLFSLNRFLLIYPVCVLFDYRDKEEDKKQNIKNIVGLLSDDALRTFYYSCLGLFFISVYLLYVNGFSFKHLLILTIPGVILLFTFKYSLDTRSDYWYYFYLDGLMMLSGVLFFIGYMLMNL